jgi:periplasmic divalent cation tolerance protein
MIIIKTTSNSHKAMKDITNTLLNKKYAACVNIIPRMRSKYILDGRIVESREVMLLIKTSEDLEANVYKTIKELHNYDVPEITTIETSKVDADYLNWINESLELGKK